MQQVFYLIITRMLDMTCYCAEFGGCNVMHCRNIRRKFQPFVGPLHSGVKGPKFNTF